MFALSHRQMEEMYGQVITTSALLGYLAIAAGVAAVFKILTSSRGRVQIPGVNITWGD